jgi:hypothetical protein
MSIELIFLRSDNLSSETMNNPGNSLDSNMTASAKKATQVGKSKEWKVDLGSLSFNPNPWKGAQKYRNPEWRWSTNKVHVE